MESPICHMDVNANESSMGGKPSLEVQAYEERYIYHNLRRK